MNRRWVVILLLLGGAIAAFGQDAAGPRTGPVYVLHLPSVSSSEVQWLQDEGFNIGHVLGPEVEIYATPEERDRLAARGLAFAVVEVQPNPPAEEAPATRALGVYHGYTGVTADLQAYAAAYPAIAHLESLGQSVQGRELWALLITDNPLVEEDEPEFRYVSTMHGDEPVGMEMCFYFINHLLTNYGSDARVTDLVNETAIWIVPLMNPDGRTLGSRFNANGFDLNRSFPQFDTDFTLTRYNFNISTIGKQPEVAAIMNWTERDSFALSANLHTGAVVVSYPLDGEPTFPGGAYLTADDDGLFIALSLVYASNNPPMFASGTFPQGITNGNEWFRVLGGMEDYHYRFAGMPEVTIELSSPKTPAQTALPTYWSNNQESLLSYLEQVHTGLRGLVTDDVSGDPIWARVKIAGNPQPVFTDRDVGDYYRLLLPGTYDVTFTAWGYAPLTVNNVVINAGPPATRLDVQLTNIVVPADSIWTLLLLVIGLLAGGAWACRRRFS